MPPINQEELRAKRGHDFTEWLRRVAIDLRTGATLKPADIARLADLSPSRVLVLLNNCFDNSDKKYKLPRERTIRQIAQGLDVDPNEGLAAVGIVPSESAPGVFIPEPGSTQFTLSTGETIFFPPGEPDPAGRVRALEAFLSGVKYAEQSK